MQAAQRLEALGRLAGEVAHDFNNLLTVISVNAEVLKGTKDPEELGHGLDEILAASGRAAALTRQLLAFSRGQPRQMRPLALDELLRGFAPLLSRLLPANVTLDVTLEAGANVMGDAGQLEQVIMNLVTNARDAVAGGGRITLSTRVVQSLSGVDAERQVVLAVSDSGPGMSEDIRARVFEPFFSTKRPGAGTGLGLAVVDSVVRQHGGPVEVGGAAGAGTTFEVRLPLYGGADVVALRSPVVPVSQRSAAAHVLVVDDDLQVRGLVERVLSSAGHRVTAVSDAESALEALEHLGSVALVVSDIVLRGLDGVSFARRLADSAAGPVDLRLRARGARARATRGPEEAVLARRAALARRGAARRPRGLRWRGRARILSHFGFPPAGSRATRSA
ncbi:MAG: response regulator [Polyangiaceae bacterium]|nr:response regulator [Polyangiaceae bacterium]